jgi:hypothetical protein
MLDGCRGVAGSFPLRCTRERSKKYSDFTLETLSKLKYAVRSKSTQKIGVSYAVEHEYPRSFYSEEPEYVGTFCGLIYL